MSSKAMILLFLANAVTVSSTCELMGVNECNKYHKVASFKFPAFVPRDQWEETCTDMRIVFNCVYQPKYMDGCTIAETFFYDMQRDVSNAVCNDGHYMNHVDCLGSKELEEKVTQECIQALSTTEVTCQILKSTVACVSNVILTVCGQQDSKYMDTLIYAFLKPYGETISCELDVPEMLMATKSTTSKTMSTKTSGKSGSKTTPKGTTSQTTPSAGSILAVPSLALGLIVTKIAISINNALLL